MKNVLLVLSVLCSIQLVNAQNVGIGTATPNSSAMLEISSSNKGLLLPRMADTSSVTSPVKGLVIYSNANNKLWYHDGSRWQQSVANGGGMDSIWFKTQDSVAYTTKKYIGINTDLNLAAPKATMQLNGDLLVQGDYIYTTKAPVAGQTYVMPNTAPVTQIAANDSVFRVYDPSGLGSNYSSNMQGNVAVQLFNGEIGVKVTSVAADFSIGTGDTLWISEFSYPECRTNYFKRWTFATVNPEDFIIPVHQGMSLDIVFRSNNDGFIGKGFNFIFTKIYLNEADDTEPDLPGPALYFNPARSAFRVGAGARGGVRSIAMGREASAGSDGVAIGNGSRSSSFGIAIGGGATAFGGVAIGGGSHADGQFGTMALGTNSEADGDRAVAVGFEARALYDDAFAAGNGASAEGWYSIAIGNGQALTGFSMALGGGTASGYSSTTIAGGSAEGENSMTIGSGTAEAEQSIAMGDGTVSRGWGGLVLGQYNNPVYLAPQPAQTSTTPLLIVGNGDNNSTRSNAFSILKNGNIGIGTWLSPANRLTINDASNTTIELQASEVEKGFVQLSGNDLRIGCFSSNPTGNIVLRSNGSTQFIVFPSGNATLNGTLTQNSDVRFKQNIQPLENSLEKLLQLNGYHYTWQPDLKKDTALQIGLIAQEVEKVFPELVSTNAEGMKSVAYQNLVPVLIEAIKEQQRRIEELERVVNRDK